MAPGLLALALLCGWAVPACDVSQPPVDDTVECLYEAQRSGVVVEGRGIVEKVLSDDLEGSRH